MLNFRPARSALLAGCALSLVMLGACKPKDDGEEKKEGSKPEALELPVRTATIEAATFVDSIRVQGILVANESVRMTAEIPGRIEGLPFQEGQRVGRGQTVVRLGARAASAQVAQAKASADLAESQYRRQKALAQKNLATAQAVEMAKAQSAQAAATLDLMQANYAKAVLRSPIEGVVATLHVSRGEVANPGAPLIEIVDIDKVKVVAQIPERDVALLEEGTEVDVYVDALNGEAFTGRIKRVGITANATTRTFPIEIEIDNAQRRLRPGMLAYLSVVRRTYSEAVVAPRDAVLDDVSSKSVFVVEDGRARRRQVELGPVRGARALVKAGLNVGDELIILGHNQVVDGQKVKVDATTTCCRESDGEAGEGDSLPAVNAPKKTGAAPPSKAGQSASKTASTSPGR